MTPAPNAQPFRPMNAPEVNLRGCLEDLKEASGLSVQAMRDAALKTPRTSRMAVLGAIEAATHRLERARQGFLASLDTPAPTANAAARLRTLAAKAGEGKTEPAALAEELAAVADGLEA